MKMQRLTYSRNHKCHDGSVERLEVTIQLDPEDYEEEAFHKARAFVEKHLRIDSDRTTLGDHLAARGQKLAKPD